MSRAEEAAQRGDFMTAAHGYRDACAASPDDEKACSRAPIFAQKATDQAIATARPACEAGDLDQCLPPLDAAWELIPNHPELTSMFDRAGQLHTERCSQWKPEGSVAEATAGLACLQTRAAQIPVQSYQSQLSGRANQLAQRFAGLASALSGPSTAGAANVLWSAAQCVAPETNVAAQADSARQGFLAQSAIPVAIRVEGKIPHFINRPPQRVPEPGREPGPRGSVRGGQPAAGPAGSPGDPRQRARLGPPGGCRRGDSQPALPRQHAAGPQPPVPGCPASA